MLRGGAYLLYNGTAASPAIPHMKDEPPWRLTTCCTAPNSSASVCSIRAICRIGRIKDAALVPLIDPARVDRFLVGGGWSWLTIRYDQVRSISTDGIYLRDEQLTPYHSDEYMLRIVPRPARPADHRRAGPQGGPRHRRDLPHRSPERQRHAARRRSRYRRAQHLPAPGAGCAARLDRAAVAAAHPSQFDPLGVLQHRRARSAAPAAPEHLERRPRADAPRRPGRHRRGPGARRPRSHHRNDRPRGRRRCSLGDGSRTFRPASSSPSSRRWRPTSSRRWTSTRPRTRLDELEEETSQEILEEMDAESRTDVSEIIEYDEDTAGYR